MKQNCFLKAIMLFLCLAAMRLSLMAQVSIPTADGQYINWNDGQITAATIENDGANIGSTGKNTVAVFTLQNETQQDYILTFATGSKNEAKMKVTVSKGEDVVLEKDVDIVNTGNWTPSATNNFFLSQLPTGTYELKFQVTEASSYAGNWGKLAVYTTDNYDKTPGSLTLSKGSYNGPRENNGEVGYIQNNGKAAYSFINTQTGVYTMAMNISKYNSGTMDIVVTDSKTGTEEISQTYAITESATPANILLEGEMTTGIKSLSFTFHNESGYICNYSNVSFTRTADHFAKIANVTIAGQETAAGDDCDWFIQLPAAYDATTTFSVDAKYGTVAAASEGITITDNGDGTFTLPTPAPGTTTQVTLTLTPEAGTATGNTTYLLKLFRIGEISIVDATVDGISIGAEQLSTLNNELSAEYQNIYTAMPTVKLQCVDGNWFEPTGEPLISDNKATYAFHVTMAGKEKDYTLTVDGIHIYNKVEGDKTVELKYTTSQDNVWTNGLYSLSPIGDGWANSGFKMSAKNNPFTLTMPVDIKVKQLIIHEFSDNYADGSLKSVTSEGMTAWIPAYHDFKKGERYTLIVNLDGHQAGEPIVFSFEGGSQTTGWFELTTETVAVTSAPVLKGQSITPTADKNHCVVALTFDREMAESEATIGGQTVKAEGGNAVLLFSIWNLDYDKDYTFTVAAGGAKDTHGNGNTEAINIPVVVGSKPVVEQKSYDFVVSNVEEFQTALAAVNTSNKDADAARKVIFVLNGDYDFGAEEQNLKAYNVSIVGESMEGVILHGLRSDIQNPIFQINNTGGNYFQDVTFRNDKDFDKQTREGVGAAVSGGKKAVFVRVAMQSQQDTQVTGESGYYKNCKLYGAVDFICGGGDHFYDQCELIMTNGGYITAPSTSPSNKWGYVFQNCVINGYEGSYTYNGFNDKGQASFTLGRPWQGEPRTYYLNTKMNILPADNGWSGMGTLITHFYEYNSTDKGGSTIDLTVRQNSPTSINQYNPWLTDEEAAKFTVENVLGGTDSWLPTEECVETDAPVVIVNEKVLSWEAVEDARCYVIFMKNESGDFEYLTNQTSTEYEAAENGEYLVRAANKNGGLFGTSEVVSVNTTTGIVDVRGLKADDSGAIYNLAGQRVSSTHKGLVIIKGRKIVK